MRKIASPFNCGFLNHCWSHFDSFLFTRTRFQWNHLTPFVEKYNKIVAWLHSSSSLPEAGVILTTDFKTNSFVDFLRGSKYVSPLSFSSCQIFLPSSTVNYLQEPRGTFYVLFLLLQDLYICERCYSKSLIDSPFSYKQMYALSTVLPSNIVIFFLEKEEHYHAESLQHTRQRIYRIQSAT